MKEEADRRLDQIFEALRSEPPFTVDWEAFDAALWARWAGHERARRRRAWWWVAGGGFSGSAATILILWMAGLIFPRADSVAPFFRPGIKAVEDGKSGPAIPSVAPGRLAPEQALQGSDVAWEKLNGQRMPWEAPGPVFIRLARAPDGRIARMTIGTEMPAPSGFLFKKDLPGGGSIRSQEPIP